MLDFTSALYLDFVHPASTLTPWRALTLGRPAALEEPPGAREVAADLAYLTGSQAGLLYPSTLHLFRDLFAAVASRGAMLLIDARAYPIARWGADHVRLDGTPCETYPHHDATALARKARRAFRSGLRPIIVTDGLCPSCGRLAPLPELARVAEYHGGHLIIDDTQALGVVGRPWGVAAPLGQGGGGTLAWYGLQGPHISAGCSLAKGFGAPLAVLLGGKDTIARVGVGGECRVHASPPSVAVIAAARQALAANTATGDLLRARLMRRTRQLREGVIRIGANLLSAMPLPIQVAALPSAQFARSLLNALEIKGIRAVVTKACSGGLGLSILLTARHTAADVDRLIAALAGVLSGSVYGNRARMAVS
jgi:8-amino-7-oxononanoate synthase